MSFHGFSFVVLSTQCKDLATMPVVLIIIAILGVGVTYAEPAIGALQAFGSSIIPEDAPYLYEILNNRTQPLVLMVGAGVGLAAVIGTIRFVKGSKLVF